jgi:hypothetical protein
MFAGSERAHAISLWKSEFSVILKINKDQQMSNSCDPLSVLAKLMFRMLLFALPDKLPIISYRFLMNLFEIVSLE